MLFKKCFTLLLIGLLSICGFKAKAYYISKKTVHICCDTLPVQTAVVEAPTDSLFTDFAFGPVDIDANFKGNVFKWTKYVEKNLDVSIPIKLKAPPGMYTATVQFKINKEGAVTDIKPLTNKGYGMEEELMRVINKSPKWNPAMLNGKPLNAYRVQSVTFIVPARK
jgi:protein TonB